MVGYAVRHVTSKEVGVVVAIGVVSGGDYPGFWVLVRHENGSHSQWPADWVEVVVV